MLYLSVQIALVNNVTCKSGHNTGLQSKMVYRIVLQASDLTHSYGMAQLRILPEPGCNTGLHHRDR